MFSFTSVCSPSPVLGSINCLLDMSSSGLQSQSPGQHCCGTSISAVPASRLESFEGTPPSFPSSTLNDIVVKSESGGSTSAWLSPYLMAPEDDNTTGNAHNDADDDDVAATAVGLALSRQKTAAAFVQAPSPPIQREVWIVVSPHERLDKETHC